MPDADIDYPLDSTEDAGVVQRDEKHGGHGNKPDHHHTDGDGVIVHVPPAVLKEYRADQEDKKRRDDRRYRLEWFAVIAAVIYAGLTYELWRSSQDSVTAALSAQRPWLVVEELTTDSNIETTGNGEIITRIRNVGGGPAFRAQAGFQCDPMALAPDQYPESGTLFRLWEDTGERIERGPLWLAVGSNRTRGLTITLSSTVGPSSTVTPHWENFYCAVRVYYWDSASICHETAVELSRYAAAPSVHFLSSDQR